MLMDVSSGWLVLDLTDSPLSLGLFWAVRSSPNLLFGMIGGATADKMDRKKLLMTCYTLYALCGLIFGYLIISGRIRLIHALALIFIRGIIRTFESPSRQSFIVDIVGRDNAMKGISLNAVGMRGIGIFGGADPASRLQQSGENKESRPAALHMEKHSGGNSNSPQ
jgi:MFS family permease